MQIVFGKQMPDISNKSQPEIYLDVIKAGAGAVEKDFDLGGLPGFLSTLVINEAIDSYQAEVIFNAMRNKQIDGLSGFLSYMVENNAINDSQAQDFFDVLKNDDILERIPEALSYLAGTGTLTKSQAQGWSDVIEAVGLDTDYIAALEEEERE